MKHILSLLAVLLIFAGCNQSPEKKFERAVIKYNKKQDDKSRKYIEESFLKDCGAVLVDKAESYIPGYNSVILKKDQLSTVITSDGFKEPWSDELKFSAYDPQTNILSVSNGYKADFYSFSFNEEGEQEIARIKSVELTESDEVAIDTICVYQDHLYYFYKRKIYRINRVTGKKEQLFPTMSFSPPYKKMGFKVKMLADSGYLALAVGDGGRYNFSLLKLSSQDAVISNKAVASLFFTLYDSNAMYVEGAAGSWSLQSYDIVSDKKVSIKEFKGLRDISSSGRKIFYVDEEGLHITDSTLSNTYEKNKLYSIERLVNNYLLISHHKQQYLVNTEKYFTAYKRYRDLLPGFFEIEELAFDEIAPQK